MTTLPFWPCLPSMVHLSSCLCLLLSLSTLAFSLLLTLVLIPILYFRWPGKEVYERYTRYPLPEDATLSH